jgi:hypothetical protein
VSNVVSIGRNSEPQSFEDSKAAIVARLREWIDDLESDPNEHPYRVLFVVESRDNTISAPKAVGARTNGIKCLGILQIAMNRQMNE